MIGSFTYSLPNVCRGSLPHQSTWSGACCRFGWFTGKPEVIPADRFAPLLPGSRPSGSCPFYNVENFPLLGSLSRAGILATGCLCLDQKRWVVEGRDDHPTGCGKKEEVGPSHSRLERSWRR